MRFYVFVASIALFIGGTLADTAVSFTSNPGLVSTATTFSYGFEFTLKAPFSVTQLGWVDIGVSSLWTQGHPVAIWDSSCNLMTRVTIPTNAPYSNFFRWVTLTTPVILPAGTYYAVGFTNLGYAGSTTPIWNPNIAVVNADAGISPATMAICPTGTGSYSSGLYYPSANFAGVSLGSIMALTLPSVPSTVTSATAFSFGFGFTLTWRLRISSLGWVNAVNGQNHQVAIYQANSCQQMMTSTVSSVSTVSANFRWQPLSSGTWLNPGNYYLVGQSNTGYCDYTTLPAFNEYVVVTANDAGITPAYSVACPVGANAYTSTYFYPAVNFLADVVPRIPNLYLVLAPHSDIESLHTTLGYTDAADITLKWNTDATNRCAAHDASGNSKRPTYDAQHNCSACQSWATSVGLSFSWSGLAAGTCTGLIRRLPIVTGTWTVTDETQAVVATGPTGSAPDSGSWESNWFAYVTIPANAFLPPTPTTTRIYEVTVQALSNGSPTGPPSNPVQVYSQPPTPITFP